MRNRSGIQGVASSPVIVGAVTVLVIIIAVFLAYNANNGLPFVSTYNLKARVHDADALVERRLGVGGAGRRSAQGGTAPDHLDRRDQAAGEDVLLDPGVGVA